MRIPTIDWRHAAPLALTLLAAGAVRADYKPVPLTPGSFTADAVVEKTAPPPLQNFVTATVDGGTNINSVTYFEQGYVTNKPGIGLPVHGTTFAALDEPNHQFQMPADYTTNDAVLVYTGIPTGTVTLTTPTAYSALSFLMTSAGGATTINYTVHHSGGADETGTLGVPDWFDNTTGPRAWNINGRVNVDNGGLDNVSNNVPNLCYKDIFLTDTVNPVTSITFTSSSGNRVSIFGTSASVDGSTFSPIAMSGFNRDVIIEANNGAPTSGFTFSETTVTMDGGSPNNTANTFYEVGFNRDAPTTGVPAAGSTWTFGNHTYTMAPSYKSNDVMYVAGFGTYTAGTLTLSSPAAYTGLSFLASAGNGPVGINVTVHHADSSTEGFTINVLDWFSGSTAAWVANGRVQPENLALNNVNGGGCKLFANDIVLASSSPVTSIDFAYSSGGRAGIFSVSGQSTGGGNYSPVAVTGYNADLIMEANPPWGPKGLTTATTVSMDRGTNNFEATWYEQGYSKNYPSSGLPPAGSTITSLAQGDHNYQMPSTYAGNNVIFVDSFYTNANLTLATPSAYTGLSFLSATANGNVTNQCIMQFQDGTQETNTFVSRDWFNNAPYAFTSRGRVNLTRRTLDAVLNSSNPRLYEAEFSLNNFSSPLTNIVLKFLGAASANGRMVVLAVSGTTNNVKPLIVVQPAGFKMWDGSNAVVSVGIGGGTPPITYQWQFGTNGVFNDLANGGVYSGVTTTNLALTGASFPNAGDYRVIATSPGGSVTSLVATVTVLTTLPDVTKPSDVITIYQGTPSGGEPPANALDNTTTKYLNFGLSNGTPYTGPVGFIVTPAIGRTTLSAIRFYTANDSENRDPADYLIEGSNDGGTTYAMVSSNSLALPSTRNAGGQALNPINQAIQEVRFANAQGYSTYRITFANVKNNASANSMQIGEVELLGVQTPTPPIIVDQPPVNNKVFVGASPVLHVRAIGYPTNFTYQWYLNGATQIPNATNADYQLTNVQLADSGKTFMCTVVNSSGSTNSITSTLTVIAAPTENYPLTILADQPVGFWRLDEADDGVGNNGAIANDYWGGHGGVYSNTTLAQAGYSLNDPNTAAAFGLVSPSNSYAGSINGVGFSTPSNNNAAFSVEAWVKGNAFDQTTDAGLVTKGPGGGGEQFCLDTGSTGAGTHGIRFYVRDAAGAVHSANTGTNQLDGLWHHVVGVCDQAHSNVVLYVDGRRSSTATITPLTGLLNSTEPVSIGSRRSSSGSPTYNNQFYGSIDEVAIYGYALSSNQVLNHYYAAGIGPSFVQDITNLVTVPEGSTVAFQPVVMGTPNLSYQWYLSTDSGGSFNPLPGETNASLVIPNVPATYTGYIYQLNVSNDYGTAQSTMAQLSVIAGPPTLLTDIPYETYVFAGNTVRLSASFGGSPPISYQWYKDNNPLSDGGRIAGAHSNVLTIANAQVGDAGGYQLFASNNQGGPVPSSLGTLIVGAIPTFNTNGLGWSLNGNVSAPVFDYTGVLTLTDGTGGEARSSFFPYPVYIGAFDASFRYQDTTVGGGGADGVAFIVQNSPDGPAALGGAGGALGYEGITPSAAVMFNIYSGAPGGVGVALGTNGTRLSNYINTTPVGISSGGPIDVHLRYTPGVLHLDLTDVTYAVSFSTNLNVDLPASVGSDSAYVGFSGATGGITSSQTVSNFVYTPFTVLGAAHTGPNSTVIYWPSTVGGYVLQSRPDLTTGTWQDVTAPITQVGDQNQLIVSPTGRQFYRLVLPLP
ncbi:MAG TPA: immunoglobulin domain-containing protein [Verrucomicrobiae bacterium]|nr:immunoglobulin domain-containing protein [Verrucomicrobiae bacterium]